MLNQFYSLLCLFYPCAVLTFLLTGPHDSLAALAWTLPLWLICAADWLSPRISSKQSFLAIKAQHSHPDSNLYFNCLLYVLALLQFR